MHTVLLRGWPAADTTLSTPPPPPRPAAVLGRFVYALNVFCKEAYGMDYQVSDYWVYEFAKVSVCDRETVAATAAGVGCVLVATSACSGCTVSGARMCVELATACSRRS